MLVRDFCFYIMINLKVNNKYFGDLHDDIFCNYTEHLYKFLNEDPVKAFYFGSFINKWFKELDQDRQMLYSKELRHSDDDLEKYKAQIEFWSKKYSNDEEIDLIDFSEYLLNNMFWDKKSDIINMALFLGSKVTIPFKSENIR